MPTYYRSVFGGNVTEANFHIDYQSNPEKAVSIDLDKYEDAIDNMDKARYKIDAALENVWEAVKAMKNDKDSGRDFDANCQKLMNNIRKIQDQIYKKYEKVQKDTDRDYKAIVRVMVQEWQAQKAKEASVDQVVNENL